MRGSIAKYSVVVTYTYFFYFNASDVFLRYVTEKHSQNVQINFQFITQVSYKISIN